MYKRQELLPYFQWHCSVGELGKQLEEQADMLTENQRAAFQTGVRNALDGLRQSLNLGVVPEPPALYREQPAREIEIAADSILPKETQRVPSRHSVKVRLKKIRQNVKTKPVVGHPRPKFQRGQSR